MKGKLAWSNIIDLSQMYYMPNTDVSTRLTK